ncbi:MAG TPA: hypothetical protein VEZ14_00495 [Dehalococcoidia bacterium]|nr:hypothetical protein [Dehalococcoidia bacterium]
MLTPLDDYLIHQTPETVDRVATSDRNFFDRYYFNAHTLDGGTFLVVAMGLYPNIGVIDAFATVMLDGKTQHILRASRALGSDRGATQVGPIGVEVIEGLRKLRVHADENEHGIGFDMTFEAAAVPYEEPHFFRRSGSRVLMDYTRLTQCGRWSGRLTAGARTFAVEPATWWGARDHSWGIRPVGGGEPPSAPASEGAPGGFFWLWSPIQFDGASMLITCSEDGDGTRWHAAAELIWGASSGKPPEQLTFVSHDIDMVSGSRTFARGTVTLARRDGSRVVVRMEPRTTLYMAAAGYAYTGGWRHGQYHGPLAVEGETWDLGDAALRQRVSGQTETVCDYHVDGLGDIGTGHGITEFLLLGAYLPYGFRQWTDVERST